uniref:Uncharacterized protein n=1 Tax=Anguilla anguilla TaxID=7936 RepID=A0A0E9VM67_ANGAN
MIKKQGSICLCVCV